MLYFFHGFTVKELNSYRYNFNGDRNNFKFLQSMIAYFYLLSLGAYPVAHSDGTIFSLVECYVESKGKRNVAELYILVFCSFPPVQCHLWAGIPAKSGAVHHWDLWRVSGGCQCLQRSS